MKFKFFKIPVSTSELAEAELNAFIAQHRITHVDRQFVSDAANSFWSLCVTWLDHDAALVDIAGKRRVKVDYKDALSAEDFAVYAKLRELRKALAEREATPVYNIFTNDQLAALVQQRIDTKTAMLAVEGIGQTRVDKYGEAFLACLKANLRTPNPDETETDKP